MSMPIQTTAELTKILLETALEVNGRVQSCPIEYLRDRNKWVFWNETWEIQSLEYNSFDEALEGFHEYCKQYIERENTL